MKRLLHTLTLLAMLMAKVRSSFAPRTVTSTTLMSSTTRASLVRFEIEIEGIHSRDITYTYDWNHYGAPRITEDNTNPLVPRVIIRYASAQTADGSWAAFTAVPAAPPAPTDGHCCTNPALNEGCEHFGVGYYGAPAAVRYHWLVDSGAGSLVQGPAVQIATPTFVYAPPIPAVAPAQVQAVIVPPPPAPEAPIREFGEPTWVKEIRTTSHNAQKVKLEELVSDDPSRHDERNWKNGEPDEVEVEWQLLQTDYNSGNGGANGELQGAPEDLPGGDEVVTRRYEFFKYVGPTDPETGEAISDKVAADGVHGVGTKTSGGVDYDLANTVVVGDYIGAQMAGFDAAAPLGLIDHVQDGDLNEPYVERTLVIGGNTPYLAHLTVGDLPQGLVLDPVLGVLSGTPAEIGVFNFTVEAADADGTVVTKAYVLRVGGVGVPPPAPVISGAGAIDIGMTQATLVWQTDQAATSQAQVDGDVQPLDPTLVNDHSILLAGLLPGTTYHCVLFSANADGVLASVNLTFTTLPYTAVNATIKSVSANSIVVNGGLLPSDTVFLPPAGGITYTGGTTTLRVGELVDISGSLDLSGACHADTLVVKPIPAPLKLSPSKLPAAKLTVKYSVTPSATGGVAPLSIDVSGLPAGLVFDGTAITGIATTLGDYPVTFTVTDSRGVTLVKVMTLSVVPKPLSLSLPLSTGTVSIPYLSVLKASGGIGELTIAASGLPPGLTLQGTQLSGIPTVQGAFPVTLTVTDTTGKSLSKSLTITIGAGPVLNFAIVDKGSALVKTVADGFIKAGTKTILFDASTQITGTMRVGATVTWTGLRDSATKLVHADHLTFN